MNYGSLYHVREYRHGRMGFKFNFFCINLILSHNGLILIYFKNKKRKFLTKQINKTNTGSVSPASIGDFNVSLIDNIKGDMFKDTDAGGHTNKNNESN